MTKLAVKLCFHDANEHTISILCIVAVTYEKRDGLIITDIKQTLEIYNGRRKNIFSRVVIDSWIFAFDSRINRLQPIEAVFTRSTVNLEFVTGFAAARANTLAADRYLEISKRVGEVAHVYVCAHSQRHVYLTYIQRIHVT